MRILSQTNDMQGYNGTVGTPTNMYDFYGHQLFVGDVVTLITCGIDGKLADNFGINFVCEENTKIANWTNQDRQYVMGISNVYNNTQFKQLEGVELNTEEWQEKMYLIAPKWRVLKVKDHSCLAIGEKIDFLFVVEVDNYETQSSKSE